jgi:6-phosphofructokinase
MIRKLSYLGIDAVISIGGDGSQRISQRLFKQGLNIIGVPKTIDNDLSATDSTFGFQTAIEIATEAVDKLVTTAASHNRVFILEVMGRDAGWIGLNAAVAGGAEICLIPEIPYDTKPKDGEIIGAKSSEVGYEHIRLGGIGFKLQDDLKQLGCEHDIRVTVLGHLQRGGVPIAYDRVLASQFGVKAFEMVLNEEFGRMVSYNHPYITSVTLEDAIQKPNLVTLDTALMKTARGLGISFGNDQIALEE